MWVSRKWFFGNVIFQEMWFLGEILFFRKFDLLGNVIFFWNVTSQEIWLPSKCDLPGSCWKAWVALVCQFPKNATSQKMLLPRNCDFLGIVTSQEKWIQFDTYNIDHVCNSAAGPVYGFHIFTTVVGSLYGAFRPAKHGWKSFLTLTSFPAQIRDFKNLKGI